MICCSDRKMDIVILNNKALMKLQVLIDKKFEENIHIRGGF